MHRILSGLLRFSTCCLVALLVAPLALAAEPSAYEPVTAKDPAIPKDQLEILLTPLTLEKLEVEAQTWMDLVEEKAREISNTEIAVKFKNRQIDSVKETAKAIEKAKDAVEKAEATGAAPPGDAKVEQKAQEAKEKAEEQVKEAAQKAEEAARTSEEPLQNEEVRAAAAEAEQRVRERLAENEGEGAAPSAAAPATAVTETDLADSQKLEETAENVKQTVEAEAGVKTALLESLNELRDERTALIDRTRLVLDELDRKGGESEAYRKYLAVVSGIRMDSNDIEGLWTTVAGWLKSEQGGIRWGINVIQFFGIVAAFLLVGRVAERATGRALRMSKGTSNLMRDFVAKSVRRIVIAFGLILGLAAMEVNVGPVLAVIGAAGFVIAFALQDTLGNFASGILILVYRPFDVGDVVDVAGVSGTVDALTIVSTRIKTFDNKIMILPNNTVWQNVITNATGSATRRVDLVFGVGYHDDVDKVQKVLEDLVREHPLTLQDPPPTIRVHELGDSSVNFICRPWVKTPDYWAVYWDLMRAVKKRFDEEGISIPFPQRDVHVFGYPNPTATPPEEAQIGK